MDEVLALAILSLGLFIGVVVTALFYVFIVRPSLLEQSSTAHGLSLADLKQLRSLLEQQRAEQADHFYEVQQLQAELVNLVKKTPSATPHPTSSLDLSKLDNQTAELKQLSEELKLRLLAFSDISSGLRELAVQIGKLDARIDEQTDFLTQQASQTGQFEALLNHITSQLTAMQADLAQVKYRQRVDRLTDIDGIGPVYAGMLYQAGIQTYHQLAAQEPDELRNLIDAPNWRDIDAESWIEQATLFASQQDKTE